MSSLNLAVIFFLFACVFAFMNYGMIALIFCFAFVCFALDAV